MEHYNKEVGDITYMSELTLDIFQGRNSIEKMSRVKFAPSKKKNKRD